MWICQKTKEHDVKMKELKCFGSVGSPQSAFQVIDTDTVQQTQPTLQNESCRAEVRKHQTREERREAPAGNKLQER